MKKNIITLLFLCGILFNNTKTFANDLSVLLAESQMQRENPMTKWRYYDGFFNFSLFKIYERTQNASYLNYIKAWANRSMLAYTKRKRNFRKLDDMYPALVLLHLYEVTKDEKYLEVPNKVIKTLKKYPRTKEGGFLHMVRHDGQLWLDGIYMINVFLAKYGQVMNDTTLYDEVIKQISVYVDLLKDPKTGLLYHAYAENNLPSFFNVETNHSNEFWGRSMGWVMMASVEVLEIMPKNYKGRNEIIKRLKDLSDALLNYQDSKTGMWYQVTNRKDLERNWLETSSTAMYAYGMAKAVRLGFLKNTYLKPAIKAYKGLVNYKIFKDEEGLYTAKDICHGTVVGDLNYYLNRPPSDNNLRGLPAVILLAEELREVPITIKNISRKDKKRRIKEKRSAKTSTYNVLNYGISKKKSLKENTIQLQILIERVHKEGGGTIYFPSGNYTIGKLTKRPKVYIKLNDNASIIGNTNLREFPTAKKRPIPKK